LLHGDDFLDVLDVLDQQLNLLSVSAFSRVS